MLNKFLKISLGAAVNDELDKLEKGDYKKKKFNRRKKLYCLKSALEGRF